MNHLIRITLELPLLFVFMGIPRLLSFMIPRIDVLLEKYEKTRSNKVCLILSGISSITLMSVILLLVRLQFGSYLEIYNFFALLIPILTIGFILLRYAEQE